MAQLWAIRHGQASLFASDYDVLSPRGEEQARTLGRYLAGAGLSFDRVYCGPAKRQRDTASLAREAGGNAWPEAVVVDGLDEHDAFGMLTRVVPKLQHDAEIAGLQKGITDAADKPERSRAFQRMFEAVMARWLRDEIDPSDAEPWAAFRTRVLDTLPQMAALSAAGEGPAKRVALFSSVGPITVLLQRALGTADLASFAAGWRIRNASISRFEFSRANPDALTLDGFNGLPHLPDPSTWTFR